MSGEETTQLTRRVVRLRGEPMARRLMIWALVAIVLLAALPVLSLVLAAAFASGFECTLNEGDIHPCVVLGLDFGQLLYIMSLGGLITALVAVPLAAMLLAVWLIVLMVLLLLRRHRRAAAL
jgi:hypothetical protein